MKKLQNDLFIPDNRLLISEAYRIGEELLKNANKDKYGAYWLTTDGKTSNLIREDLYGGTTGIAFYLCELYRCTDEKLFLENAILAADWILSYMKTNPLPQSYAFYTGRFGIVFFLTYLFRFTGNDIYLKKAGEIVSSFSKSNLGYDPPIDLLNGLSGTLWALLYYHNQSKDDLSIQLIEKFTLILISKANLNQNGVFWDKNIHQIKGLCGFSHGTSGIGYVLTELGHYFNNQSIKNFSRQAFLYEDQFFNETLQDWPDFRFSLFEEENIDKAKKAFLEGNKTFFTTENHMTAWCHGAPGIGLARLRSYELTNNSDDYNKLKACCNRVKNISRFSGGYSSFSLCHGMLGNATLLIESKSIFNEELDNEIISRYMAGLAIRQKEEIGYYRSGYHLIESEDFGLFNGTSGIGHFYLRLANIEKTESILLPRIGSAGKIGLENISNEKIWDITSNKLFPKLQRILEGSIPMKVDFFKNSNVSMRSQIVNHVQNNVIAEDVSLGKIFKYERKKITLGDRFANSAYNYIRNLINLEAIENVTNSMKIDNVMLKLNEDLFVFKLPYSANNAYSRIILVPHVTDFVEYFVSESTYSLLKHFKSPSSLINTFSEYIDTSDGNPAELYTDFKNTILYFLNLQVLLPAKKNDRVEQT